MSSTEQTSMRSKVADWTTIICGPLSILIPILIETYKSISNNTVTVTENTDLLLGTYCILAFAFFFLAFIKIPKLLNGKDHDMGLTKLKWLSYISCFIILQVIVTWIAKFIGATTGDLNHLGLIGLITIFWLLFGAIYAVE